MHSYSYYSTGNNNYSSDYNTIIDNNGNGINEENGTGVHPDQGNILKSIDNCFGAARSTICDKSPLVGLGQDFQ